MNNNFKDYLQSQAQLTLKSIFTVANILTLVALAVDIFYAPADWNSIEWKIIFLSTPAIIICYVILGLLYTNDLLKFLTPIQAISYFGFSYSTVTWIGTILKLNYFQGIYVALINLSYAFFAFEKRQHTLLVLLTTLSYVIGRFLTPVQPELIDVWISFDLLVGFTVVLGFPILLGRLKHFEIFFNNLRTIEEQKALNIYSSKMSALGEMAAGMAHEINNPLAIVSGMAFQIGMYIDRNVENKEEKIKESTIRITQTVNRISHIISSLRTFSKESDTVQRENFDIEKMIVNTLNLCNSRLEENKISLSISNHSKSKNLYSNSVAFMQILLSLINNSIYALKDSNNKWIQILIIDSEDPPASPNTTTNIKIKFTDSGPGIPESIQDKIMQPFFTTKPIGQGSGLGLSTAKGLAESLNGTLYLDKKSENTCFVLELPVPQNMDSLPNG